MISWQHRGEGPLAQRFHRLTAAEAAATEVPAAPGVCELEVGGEQVFGFAAHTPALRGRPLRLSPVVYSTAAEAAQHAEAWLTRDRDTFYGE